MVKKEVEINFPAGKVMIILVLLIAVVVGLSSFAIVGPGERGVLTTLGQVEPWSLGEGIHFKIPIIQGVSLIDVKTQKVTADASAASKDLQIVQATVALNYKVNADQAHILYQTIGMDYVSRVISPAIEESVKAATAQFTAEELITQRAMVKNTVEENLKARLSGYSITVQNLSIVNFEFSEGFNASIEAKQIAEQEALKAERVLQQIKIEKEQTITQAEAENERVKLEADASAYSVKAQGDAEAYALEVVRIQLEQSKKLIEYESVKRWNGDIPTYMMAGSGSFVPFIDLSPGVN